jgi:hypothetical protein
MVMNEKYYNEFTVFAFMCVMIFTAGGFYVIILVWTIVYAEMFTDRGFGDDISNLRTHFRRKFEQVCDRQAYQISGQNLFCAKQINKHSFNILTLLMM